MQLPSKMISVKDASRIVGVSVRRIAQMLEEKTIDGVKFNPRLWLVDRNSAEKAAKTERKVGRPKKSA